MATSNVFDSVADFIASLNPNKVLELRADLDVQQRLEALIEKEKMEGLTPDEKEELGHYIVLERLIRLAKARARYRLGR